MQVQEYSKNQTTTIKSQIKITDGYALYRAINSNGGYIGMGIWSSGDIISPDTSLDIDYELKALTDLSILPVSIDKIPLNVWNRFNWYMQCSRQYLIKERLEHLLDYMKTYFLCDDPYTYQKRSYKALKFQLPHQDIADLLGTSRVTVTRILVTMERQGKIQRDGRQLLFLN